jgi:hypothetical protein
MKPILHTLGGMLSGAALTLMLSIGSANAFVSMPDPMAGLNFTEPREWREGDQLLALCGFWQNPRPNGNCDRLAKREGITVAEAIEMGREYEENR